MKKLLLTTSLFILVLCVNGQVRFGYQVGCNFSNDYFTEQSGSVTEPNSLLGYHLGGILEIPFYRDFSFQPSVLFTTKGFQQSGTSNGVSANEALTMYYIEIPANFMYKIGNGSTKLLLFGGPYIAFGIGALVSVSANGITQTESAYFGSNQNDLNFIDFGFNLGTGLELNNFEITVQYGFGLINLSHYSGETMHNRVVGISLAYLFGKK